jgi:prevent-host-death family protein
MAKMPYIIPVTDLRQNAAGVIRRVRDSREPVYITQRGRTAAVVLSAEAYERAERDRDILAALARGEREIEAGGGSDLVEVMTKAAELLRSEKP